jgi:anti-sigma-K factor RskA
MKIVRGDGRGWGDDEVQAALRSHYASPTDESYWSTMERRIMTAVGAEMPREWWSWFPGWVRAGLSVAACAVLVAGVATWQVREAQEEVAVKQLEGGPDELPILTETVGADSAATARAATLRYLIAHD